MTEKVYTVVESVKHEGDRIVSIHGDEQSARDAANEQCEQHRYSGEWDEWQTDGQHVVSYGNRDVTFVVKWWVVQ